jgi:hypothetical protein
MNVSSTALFRALVVTAAALHGFLWLAPVFGPGRIAGFDAWLLNFDGYGASIAYSPVLYWCLFASWLLVLTGLFFYIPAARAGLVILLVITTGLGLAWGIRVLTPFETAAASLLAIAGGVLAAMSYLPPVRVEFGRHR